ncbi:MAG TPA: DHA2 family efflux MFS transporter permease subunit [Hypericibacter adhaerens]|jgi:DHA2 family multidrug resistance protein|uniref:EmrB/QacA family drug resistance transporter n=1 Tax=Hypericibacter adhaerens TaxID=2602016 RepID=A0A5J6N0V6_9PROT|nr:DHA2 family efflux MFS transporter permease subunit [Hypericibacter adhaerens]QEX22585.1 EmrB/QacA family drug resistance transporter [Hypericibacter adhaerens]HWA41899.1 DHA2 family efflux MFS transporter permease subunit [Hypericibacter adhaerens]
MSSAAAGPAGAAAGRIGHVGFITVCVMLATIMQALDTTIANVALPHMQGSLSATQDQISWVLTSYIVAAAIMTPPTGVLAAKLGRKRLFIWAVVGFTVTSMLCGIATSLEEMVLFRLLQGVFGAALVPLSQSVLLDTYPREKHGQAMALWGVGVMVGPILGPTLGGYLTEVYNWRWVFYINLPFGILAMLGIMAFLPETERDHQRRFDVFGFAMLSIAIGALQMMLDRGELLDWFGSTEIIVEAVISGTCFAMFLVHIFTHEHPFLEPAIFRDRNLSIGLILIFLVGIILLATMALLPPYLQNLMDYPVITTGFILAPRGVGTMIAMMVVGRLLNHVDQRGLIGFGLALAAYSLWQMAGFTPDVSRFALIESGVIQGLGLGFIFVPLSTITFSTLAPRYRTEAAGLFSLMRNVGSSIGISVVMALLSSNTQINHAEIAQHVTPFGMMMQEPWLPAFWSPATQTGVAALNGEVTRQASAIAYVDDFLLMMWVTLLGAPLLLLLRKPRRSGSSVPAAAMAD